MTRLDFLPSSDLLFKIFFVHNLGFLRDFLAAVLEIPLAEIGEIVIKNPDLTPEIVGGKFCRLDLSVEIAGAVVDVEIQVKNEGNFPERSLHYWAKLFVNALGEGEDYRAAPRAIIISILDFNLFAAPEFHSEFAVLEKTRHDCLSDKLALHFFELRKLPKTINRDDPVELWLRLFRAKTVEELDNLTKIGGTTMTAAVAEMTRLGHSAELEALEWARYRARHDEVNALHTAEKRGIAIGKKDGIEIGEKRGEKRGIKIGETRGETRGRALTYKEFGLSVEEIARRTGLTPEEIERL
jgi:predicted transposase/invertase (TIGR01784 family)